MPRSAVAVLMLLITANASAQFANEVAFGLERDVNRYRWSAELNYRTVTGDWSFDIADRFSSDAYVLFGNKLVFRDENLFDWSAARKLSDAARFEIRGTADWFSLSRVFLQHTLAGISYSVNPAVFKLSKSSATLSKRDPIGISPPWRASWGNPDPSKCFS